MKPFMTKLSLMALALLLGGCLSSANPPIGINCNSAVEKGPYWDWPLVCQPNGS